MSDYSQDEVFFCDACRSQHESHKGTRCVHCGRERGIWNTRKEGAAVIPARWERMRSK